MATFTIIPASGSTDFRGVAITATSSPGTTFHTAQASATLPDFVTLDICNTDTVARPYTVEWGGTTSPGDYMTGVVLAGATSRICTQKPIRNSLIVKIASITMTWVDGNSYTGSGSVLTAHGYVQEQTS